MSEPLPRSTPGELLGYRDGIYASDLLICAVAHLNFFTLLHNSPADLEELCAELEIARRPADVMVTLFLAMGFIDRKGSQYVLKQTAKDYLVSGVPYSLVPYYASLGNRPQCLEFVDVLRAGQPAGWSSDKDGGRWLESMQDAQFADAFTAAMDSRGAFLADELAKRLNCVSYESLLDVGGGSGVYACALAHNNSNLAANVLEMSPVDHAARKSIAARGMTERVEVVAGDMFKGIPDGHDIHLFANVFHDWAYDSVQGLAKSSYDALNDGGMIAVFDAHLNEAKDGPLSVAQYSCLIMHATPGRCYSTREIGQALSAEGFVGTAVTDIAASRSVIRNVSTSLRHLHSEFKLP